jgi:hypothetical protein
MRRLDDYEMIRGYFRKLTARTKHHAKNVTDVIPLLAFQAFVRCDKTEGVQVREFTEGRGKKAGTTGLGNICYFFVESVRYALTYLHDSEQIALRKGSSLGKIIAKFDNRSTFQDIDDIFAAL